MNARFNPLQRMLCVGLFWVNLAGITNGYAQPIEGLLPHNHLFSQQINATTDVQVPPAYVIDGEDPYVVIKARGLLSQVNGALVLDLPLILHTDDRTSTDFAPKLELFLGTSESENTSSERAAEQFDPLFRAIYPIEPSPLSRLILKLALPDIWAVNETTVLRLDIDHCSGCLLIQAITDEYADNTIRQPREIKNGALTVPVEGLALDLASWKTNDLERTGQTWRTVGGDPHWVSPSLEVASKSLGGIMFNLKLDAISPAIKPTFVDTRFGEVFHRNTRHGFTPNAVSIFRLAPAQSYLEATRTVLIPLDHVNKEAQFGANTVGALRLDLPPIQNGAWNVTQVQLVPPNALTTARDAIPMVRNLSPVRTHGVSRIKAILLKFQRDWLFLVFYSLGLVLLGVWTRRQFQTKR